MSGSRVKLDRANGCEHTVNAWSDDQLRFWSPDGIIDDRCNLSLDNAAGDSVVTIYGLRMEQLADLYATLGKILGKPSSVSVQHLRQLHAHLQDLFPPGPPPPEQHSP